MYPRSFADSDGDGIGDLAGIVSRLDHLEWLGVDAVWLNPISPSPNADWGYDVSDYCDVHPDLGTLEDLDRLVAAAGERGIRILLDLVPNHTSERHPWFGESRADRDDPRRAWYVWADGRDGGPPNNWASVFGGAGWTLDERTGQWYLHGFLPEQPDLNWWSGAVRDEFDRILRFWLDRGVAGFRIDVAHRIVKDAELRDNLPVSEDDPPHVRRLGQRETYTMNQPELHEVLRRWRALADAYEPPRLLLGEAYVLDLEVLAGFYGDGDELHLAFNFVFVNAAFDASGLAEVVDTSERTLPGHAWPVWTASNHDAGRFPTRWCGGDEGRIRCALLALLTLRGTPVLYYGDEIGMEEVEVPYERTLDPVGKRAWPERRGRDPGRTPMQWADEPGIGFTTAPRRAWLPLGDAHTRNVASQRGDRASTLHFCRDAIALRRRVRALRLGGYERLAAPVGVWAWRRGGQATVGLNIGGDEASLAVPRGRAALATRRSREGEAVRGTLSLAPGEGVVVLDEAR